MFKQTIKRSFLFLFPVSLFLVFSFKSNERRETDTTKVVLEFVHQVGDKKLEFGKTYTNGSGEDYSVSAFKYYISQIGLSGKSFKMAKANTHYLINEEKPESKIITEDLEIKPGYFSHVGILLGVDSLHNVSGTQTGALDPIHGMFWTWNTGYIMTKLEGHSPVSKMPGNFFEYHIGGYKGEHSIQKWINLPFPQSINIEKGKTTRIRINVDLQQWFKDPETISIGAKSSITSPGPNARKIAVNYYDMFSVIDAKTE